LLSFKRIGVLQVKFYLLASCIVLMTLSNGATAELDNAEKFPPDLFLSAENIQDMQPRESPTIVRSRLVTVDFGLLPDPEENFTAEPDNEILLNLNLFHELEFTVNIHKIEKNRSGSYSWYGELQDVPMSRVVLVVKNNMVFGNISKRNFSYQIRHISDGVHAIYEIDPTKFPPASEPIVPNLKSESTPSPSGELQKEVKIHISGADSIPLRNHISGRSNIQQGGDAFFSQDPFSNSSQDAMSSSNVLTVPDSVNPSSSSSSSSPETQADDGSIIDLLVVYTAEARVVEGGASAIESLIDLAESETNAAYSNSGVGHVVRVVAKQEISFSESGFNFTDFLNSAQDGSISGLHDLRNTHGADLVVVLVDGDDSLCGLAFLMNPVSSSFASYGYSVTQTNCATGNYTFGHEIGHNMSARHDRAADSTDGAPFDYNHGYVDDTNNFKTIMGTGSNTRIQYFSNPNVSFDGAVTGIAEGDALAADNRLTFQNTASTVANFRESISTSSEAIFQHPNSQRVVSSYWQSDSESYSFIAVTHTSLSGMASQIGVQIRAIKNDGSVFGSAQTFTLESATTERVFIVRSEHPFINSTTVPDAKLITDSSTYQYGFVHVTPVASNPENSVDDTYRDTTMLSFWGAIITEANTAGFAMEFIGDMGDSQATNVLDNNAQVVGPAAP
jgi:hypothetical protein